MTPDQKMAALFASETPPARDFAFEAVMAQRIAARRMWARIAAMIPLTVAAAAGLWGLQPLWPTIEAALTEAGAATPDLIPALVLTASAGAGAAVLIWISGRLRRA
jgi:hypothetical protein